jgi:hypothetical protein
MECGRKSRCASVVLVLCGAVVSITERGECCFTMEEGGFSSCVVYRTIWILCEGKARQGWAGSPSMFDG